MPTGCSNDLAEPYAVLAGDAHAPRRALRAQPADPYRRIGRTCALRRSSGHRVTTPVM
jgi:hypothetical protein